MTSSPSRGTAPSSPSGSSGDSSARSPPSTCPSQARRRCRRRSRGPSRGGCGRRTTCVTSGYGSHRAQACLLPTQSLGLASARFILERVANIERLVRDEKHETVTFLGRTVVHRHPLGEPDKTPRAEIPLVGPQGAA